MTESIREMFPVIPIVIFSAVTITISYVLISKLGNSEVGTLGKAMLILALTTFIWIAFAGTPANQRLMRMEKALQELTAAAAASSSPTAPLPPDH